VQNPTVKFDNKNTLSTNRLMLVVDESKHTHVGTLVNQQDATCTEFGVKAYYKCACGIYFVDSACTEEIADLDVWKSGEGRIWKEAHTGGNATCKDKAKCAVCGNTYGELGDHEYDTEWSSDETDHWKECMVCEAEADRVVHTDSDKNGKCDTCGEAVTSEEPEPTAIPTVVPTAAPTAVPIVAPTAVPSAVPTVPKGPQTGDDSNPWFFGGIGFAAMIAGAGTFYRRKKKTAK
jgi:LPXTG-motif cell wall-anchored protein